MLFVRIKDAFWKKQVAKIPPFCPFCGKNNEQAVQGVTRYRSGKNKAVKITEKPIFL